MDRLEKLKKSEYSPIVFTDPITPEFQNILDARKDSGEDLSSLHLMKLSKELIFDIVDGKPVFHQIAPFFDTRKLEIKYDHLLDIMVDSNEDNEITKEVVNTLGLATALEVPVYPNNPDVEDDLARYYEHLIIHGFVATDSNGDDVKLIPRNAIKIRDLEINQIEKLDLTRTWTSGEIALIKKKIKGELFKLERANQTLEQIDKAIEELETLLDSKERNENSIQACLTSNPILFGLDYRRVIPKFKLGSEYETDYVLEKWDGVIDVVEIESSNLKPFNKNGDPSSKLTHSEQQVINWLNWIENHGEYARAKLPNLRSPKAIVIIGHDDNLNEKGKENLILRNKLFNGRVIIMTYNDFLKRAQLIKDRLEMKDDV